MANRLGESRALRQIETLRIISSGGRPGAWGFPPAGCGDSLLSRGPALAAVLLSGSSLAVADPAI